MFLKKCTEVKKFLKKRRKMRKSSKIEEEAKVETEAKRLKAFNLVEKSFKPNPKSALTDPAQKTREGDSWSKWLLQPDSTILPGSIRPKPKTGSKDPPGPPPAWLGNPLKRKGPGRQ